MKQMELLHHYTTDTYATLAFNPQGPLVQQIEVPRLAFAHSYLMDCILAISALHLASLQPDDAPRLVADAVVYQARALTTCRQQLENLDASQCHALYHASTKLGVIALAFRAVDPESAASKPTETLIQLSQLWRGTGSILQASRELVDAETYSTFFPGPVWVRPDAPAPPRLQAIFETLRRKALVGRDATSCEEGSPHTSTVNDTVYISALDLLEVLFQVYEPEPSRILAWFVQTPLGFMELLDGKDPLASAIVMLYSVTFRKFGEKWWTKDFGRQLAEDLAPIVLASSDPELAEVAAWVME